MSISVAIPIFNAEEYLALAIQSVLNQTFTDFELILLDDGSADKSLCIAKSFDDPRIRIISDGKNKGLPQRLNEIIDLAQYDLIARMDADDIIPDYRLQLQYEYMQKNTNKNLVSMGMAYFDGETYYGHLIPEFKNKLTLEDMYNGNSGICHATLLVRKAWYQRNRYNNNIVRIEDYELWLRAFIQQDLSVGYIDQVGYYYRSDNSLSINKYYLVYKSYLALSLGLYKNYNFRVKFFLKTCMKLFAIAIIFFLRQQSRYLSQKERFEKGTMEQCEFEKQLLQLKRTLR
jgi:glycosyltransferase involved in cell wall biosynthesis